MNAWLERRERWVLALAVLVGTVLRLVRLGADSLWFDELFSLFIARGSLPSILANEANSGHPFLYYALLHFWLSLGQSEAVVRLLSVIAGILLIPAVYYLAYLLLDKPTGLIAAWLAALFPFQIYYSRELRMYSLTALWSALILALFVRTIRHGKPGAWVGYVLVGVLGVYTNYYVAFDLAAATLVGLAIRRWRCQWKYLIGANACIGLLFVPQAIQFWQKIAGNLGNSVAAGGDASLLSPCTALYYLVFGHTAPLWLVPVGLFLILAVLFLASYEELRWRPVRQGGRQTLALLWAIVLMPMLVTLVISLTWLPIWFERTFTVASPAVIVIMASGIARARQPFPLLWLGGGLVVTIGLSLVAYFTRPDIAKPPMREASAYVVERLAAGDLNLHLTDGGYLGALYYAPETDPVLLLVERSNWLLASTYHDFGGRTAGPEIEANRFWLTVIPSYLTEDQAVVLSSLREKRGCVEAARFGDVRVVIVYLCGSSEMGVTVGFD
jgi:mannosyltransferase